MTIKAARPVKTSFTSSIYLSKKRLVLYLALVFLFNLLVLAGTWVLQKYNQALIGKSQEELELVFNRPAFIFLQQFDLSSENVAATWYSSMLLLMAGVTCLLCFLSDKVNFIHPKEKILSYGWVGLGFIFATLSLDEIGSFHETIGDSAFLNSFGTDIGWAAFYALIALVGLYMVGFGLIRLRRNTIAFIASAVGILFFLSNPFQEIIEVNAYKMATDPSLVQRPIGLLLLEEGTEIFGSWCFLLATLVYLSNPKGRKQRVSLGAAIPVPYVRKQILISLLVAFFALGLGLVAALTYDRGPKDVEVGILENWFPSALTLLVSLHALYHSNLKTTLGKTYLALALLSIGLSAFYGSNVFEFYFFWGSGMKSGLLFRGILVFTSAVIAIALGREATLNLSRIALAFWFFGISAAFLLGMETSLQFAFIAYSFLAISFASTLPEPVKTSAKVSSRA